jgi:hypothetical protein
METVATPISETRLTAITLAKARETVVKRLSDTSQMLTL